ncbi:MAG: extracellular solute-binding protein [Aeromicrobium sp.]
MTWYTNYAEDRAKAAADAFTAKYGIPVALTRMPSSALIQRFTAERDAGAPVADLLDYSGLEPFRDADDGDFVVIADEELPSLDAWPEDEIVAGAAPRLSLDSFVLAYNTDLLTGEDVPESWEDILSPAIADTVAHPKWDSSIVYIQFLQMLRDGFGDDFLAEIAALDSTEYESGVPAMQALAAGEHSVVIPTAASFVLPLQEAGAPVDFVIPSPTTGIGVYGAVPFDAPNPRAGLLLLDFLMSAEGQEVLNANVSVSVLEDVPGALVVDELVVVDRDVATESEAELLALVSPR